MKFFLSNYTWVYLLSSNQMLANGIVSPKTVEAVPVGKHKRWKQEVEEEEVEEKEVEKEEEEEEEVEEKEVEKEEEEKVYTPSEEEESKGEESGCEVGVTMDIRVVLTTI